MMMSSFFSLLYLIFALVSSQEQVNGYEGYKLVRIGGFGEEQNRELEKIEADVWGINDELGFALVQISPMQMDLIHRMPSLFSNVTVVEDLGEMIKEETERIHEATVISKAQPMALGWFDGYHRYEEIKSWFEALQRESPALVKQVKSIGKSSEGRDIFAVHLTASQAKARPKIWVQCLIHSREWISGSVCQYLAFELLNAHKQTGRSLLSQAEVVIVPVVNPDGYVFSWTSNRLWRKNRRGPGVDLNRNFADHWGVSGTLKTPVSDIYCGPSPASEPETRAIQGYFSYLAKQGGGVVAAIDYHSFSQLILRPIGWTTKISPHDNFLKYASNFMAQSMRATGRQYQVKRSSELYLNSGSATDWFYANGARYSIAIELPPGLSLTDNSGFLLPASEILGCCKEAHSGFLTFADFALNNPLS